MNLHDIVFNIRRFFNIPLTPAEKLVALVCTDIANNPKDWHYHDNEDGGLWNIIFTEGRYHDAKIKVNQHYLHNKNCSINEVKILKCQYNRIKKTLWDYSTHPVVITAQERQFQEVAGLLEDRRTLWLCNV